MAEPISIPLFPLGLVLYPEERLPLHIFEPRYREMIQDCMSREEAFGIVLVLDGKRAEIGCTARIDRVLNTYEDGRMDIIVTGEQRFRVQDTSNDSAYMTAAVELIVEPEEPPLSDLRERVITQHMRLLELAGRTVRPNVYRNDRGPSFFIAHNAGLSPEQKQEVLEMLTENERITYLVHHFEALIPRVEQIEEVRRKAQSNGHFKDYPGPDS